MRPLAKPPWSSTGTAAFEIIVNGPHGCSQIAERRPNGVLSSSELNGIFLVAICCRFQQPIGIRTIVQLINRDRSVAIGSRRFASRLQLREQRISHIRTNVRHSDLANGEADGH